jgi:hypothetical protein
MERRSAIRDLLRWTSFLCLSGYCQYILGLELGLGLDQFWKCKRRIWHNRSMCRSDEDEAFHNLESRLAKKQFNIPRAESTLQSRILLRRCHSFKVERRVCLLFVEAGDNWLAM